jgi:hypothetical protein
MEKISISNQQFTKNGFAGHILGMAVVILFRIFQVIALLVCIGFACLLIILDIAIYLILSTLEISVILICLGLIHNAI